MDVSKMVAPVTQMVADKRRFKQYRSRVASLPAPWPDVAAALERYLLHFGPNDGGTLMAMLDDLADLLEASAADGTPVRDVVGDDPVDFAETFLANYEGTSWLQKERQRLARAIDEVAGS